MQTTNQALDSLVTRYINAHVAFAAATTAAAADRAAGVMDRVLVAADKQGMGDALIAELERKFS